MVDGETIAAIATAAGEASIAVIRVSGSDAFPVVERVFRGRRKLSRMRSHSVAHGRIVSLADGLPIDEVLATVMRGPHTYTTEDVVEIGTHGGRQSVQAVLTEILRAGARLAEPGEFTKRAFLGGRIDLAQAEGVMELIGAQTRTAREAALRQVEGSLTAAIRALRADMLSLMAHVEVTIDYPEHDEEAATSALVAERSRELCARVRGLLAEAQGGRLLREGLRVAIVGRPNAGKSSLLNALVRTDRAIVTDVPGTTRDVLEERVQIAGVPLVLLDTAGIRLTEDVVERIGVERSRRAFAEADIVIVMVDGSSPLVEVDRELLAGARNRASLVIVNKADLPSVVSVDDVRAAAGDSPVIRCSVTAGRGLDEIRLALGTLLARRGIHPQDATFVANARHIRLLERALELVSAAGEGANAGQTLDLVAVDLQEAWTTLGDVIGESPREDLLDQIFSQFCLGK